MNSITFPFFITTVLFLCVLFSEGVIARKKKEKRQKSGMKGII